jgi:cytochrome b pre-mRNA-processing protein 3
MDDCMREMAVGDLTVPKKVKRAAATFYERATIYHRDLMESGETALIATLARSILAGSAGGKEASKALAGYARGASAALRVEPFDDWVQSGAPHRLLKESVSNTRMTAT